MECKVGFLVILLLRMAGTERTYLFENVKHELLEKHQKWRLQHEPSSENREEDDSGRKSSELSAAVERKLKPCIKQSGDCYEDLAKHSPVCRISKEMPEGMSEIAAEKPCWPASLDLSKKKGKRRVRVRRHDSIISEDSGTKLVSDSLRANTDRISSNGIGFQDNHCFTFDSEKVKEDSVHSSINGFNNPVTSASEPDCVTQSKHKMMSNGSKDTNIFKQINHLINRIDRNQSTDTCNNNASSMFRGPSRLNHEIYQSYVAGILHSSQKSEKYLKLQKLFKILEKLSKLENGCRLDLVRQNSPLRSRSLSNINEDIKERRLCYENIGNFVDSGRVYEELETLLKDRELSYFLRHNVNHFKWKIEKDRGLTNRCYTTQDLLAAYEENKYKTFLQTFQHFGEKKFDRAYPFRQLCRKYQQLDKRSRMDKIINQYWKYQSRRQPISLSKSSPDTFIYIMENSRKKSKERALYGYFMNEHCNRYEAYVNSRRQSVRSSLFKSIYSNNAFISDSESDNDSKSDNHLASVYHVTLTQDNQQQLLQSSNNCDRNTGTLRTHNEDDAFFNKMEEKNRVQNIETKTVQSASVDFATGLRREVQLKAPQIVGANSRSVNRNSTNLDSFSDEHEVASVSPDEFKSLPSKRPSKRNYGIVPTFLSTMSCRLETPEELSGTEVHLTKAGKPSVKIVESASLTRAEPVYVQPLLVHKNQAVVRKLICTSKCKSPLSKIPSEVDPKAYEDTYKQHNFASRESEWGESVDSLMQEYSGFDSVNSTPVSDETHVPLFETNYQKSDSRDVPSTSNGRLLAEFSPSRPQIQEGHCGGRINGSDSVGAPKIHGKGILHGDVIKFRLSDDLTSLNTIDDSSTSLSFNVANKPFLTADVDHSPAILQNSVADVSAKTTDHNFLQDVCRKMSFQKMVPYYRPEADPRQQMESIETIGIEWEKEKSVSKAFSPKQGFSDIVIVGDRFCQPVNGKEVMMNRTFSVENEISSSESNVHLTTL